jgi:hypothetical protein
MTSTSPNAHDTVSDLPPSFANVARQTLLDILARDYPDAGIDIDRTWINGYELKPLDIPPFTDFPDYEHPAGVPRTVRKLTRAVHLLDSLIDHFLGYSLINDGRLHGVFASPHTVAESALIEELNADDIRYLHMRFASAVADAYKDAFRDYWSFAQGDGMTRSEVSLHECMQALTQEAQVGVEQGNLTVTQDQMLENMLGYCRDQTPEPLQQHGVFGLSRVRPGLTTLEFVGCFVLSEVCSPDEPIIDDTRMGSVLLYTPNSGVEGFDSFGSLVQALEQRWADPEERDWLAKNVPLKHVEPLVEPIDDAASGWAFSVLSGDFLKQQFNRLVLKHLEDFAHCIAMAKSRALNCEQFLDLLSDKLDLRYQFDNFLNLDRNDRTVVDAAMPDWWHSMAADAQASWLAEAKAFGRSIIGLQRTINDLEASVLDSNRFLDHYLDTLLLALLAEKNVQLSPDDINVEFVYLPQVEVFIRPGYMLQVAAEGKFHQRYTLRELARKHPSLEIKGYTRHTFVTGAEKAPIDALDGQAIDALMKSIDFEEAFGRFLEDRLKNSAFARTLREKSGQLMLLHMRMGLLVARQTDFPAAGLEWIAAVLETPDAVAVRKVGQKNIQIKFLTINGVTLSNLMLIAPEDAGALDPAVLCTINAPDGVVFRWFSSIEALKRDYLQDSLNHPYLLGQMPMVQQSLARQTLAFDEWFQHYRLPGVFRHWPSPIPMPTLTWEVVGFSVQQENFCDESHGIRVEQLINDAKSYAASTQESGYGIDIHLALSIAVMFLPPPVRIPLALGLSLYSAWQGFRKIDDNDFSGAAQELLTALGYLLIGGIGARALPTRLVTPIRAPRPAPPLVRRIGPDGSEHIGYLMSPANGSRLADGQRVATFDPQVFRAVQINNETFYVRSRYNLFGHSRLYRQVLGNPKLLTYSDEFGVINPAGVWVKALYQVHGAGARILRNAYRELERLTARWPSTAGSLSLNEKQQFESVYLQLANYGNAEYLPHILSYCEGGSADINALLRASIRNNKTRRFLHDLFRLNAYQGVAFRVTHVSNASMQLLRGELGKTFMDRGVQSASVTRFNASRWAEDGFITQNARADNHLIFMILDSTIPKKNMFSHLLGDHVGVVPNTPMQLTAVREVGDRFFAYFGSPQELSDEVFDIYSGEAETVL